MRIWSSPSGKEQNNKINLCIVYETTKVTSATEKKKKQCRT